VSGTDHDDRSIDRLLEAAMRARRLDDSPAGPSCVDAETIAAWADGALPPGEARAVEMHLSGCMRCLETAAVFAKSAPPPLPARAPWWRSAHVRWLAPALAGAGALTLMLWTRGPDVSAPTGEKLQQAQTTARNEMPADSARPSLEADAPPQPRQDRKPSEAAAPQSKLADRAKEANLDLQSAPASKAVLEARDAARGATTPTPAGPPVGAALPATPGVTLLPPPPPPAPVPPPAVANLPRQTVTAPPPPGAPPPARPQAAAIAPPQPPTAREEFARKVAVISEFRASAVGADSARRISGGRGGGGRGAGAAQREAAAPAAPVRWRVMSTGVVEKSTDGGATWTQAAVSPTLQITTGAAPSPTVCWLVGRGGVVLLSTDGVAFTRVAFPVATDLTAIRAGSALEATVTTAPGLTMTTTDGGRTWQ
jgi:hypothetical protein